MLRHYSFYEKGRWIWSEYWLSSNCVYGDSCRYLHSWFRGDGFTRLTQLEGRKKAITGITLPSGSDKLYSGCRDGTVRVWDCNTGQCANVINLGGEVGSLISEGPWVFVGMQNVVKAWNIHTCAEHSLTGPVGQVYAMIVCKDTLFAGAQDGAILAWKSGSETNPFHLAASLKGHSHSVVSLAVWRKHALLWFHGPHNKSVGHRSSTMCTNSEWAF